VPEPIRTKDGAAAYTQTWFTAFPDLHVRLVDRVIGEDSIASQVEFSGTNTGTFALGGTEIPATSKHVVGHGAYFNEVHEIEAISIHRMEGGKIAETWQVWDTLSFLRQLGVA
jgi:predicted ester cyclase